MKSSIYVVYDSENRIAGMYAYRSWAERKAKTVEGGQVVEYLHPQYVEVLQNIGVI